MAKLEIDPEHEEFAQALERAVQDREVKLTTPARQLLRLSAEAWIEEGPKLKRRANSAWTPRNSALRQLATDIVDAAMNEAHVVEHRQHGREVPAHVLSFALVAEGKRIMKGLLDKGF